MFWLLGLLIPLTLIFSGCTRAGKSGSSSSLIIQTPHRQQLSKSGLNAFVALPTDRRLCYGVSIKGVGIDGFAGSSCAPATGIVGGFIEEGQALEVFVPRGENRTVELYLYAMPVGSTASCPEMAQNLQGEGLKSTYLIGSKTGVSLLNDVETVEIVVDFPGLANTLASQLNVPASCTPGLTPNKKGFHVSVAAGTASNAIYQLRGRIGRPQSGTTATSISHKLHGRVQ